MLETARLSVTRPRLSAFAVWASLWLLVASLLWAQTSALMHRVVHGASVAHAVAAVDVQSASAKVDASPHHWLTHVWGDHGQRSDCQFFDQHACAALPLTQVVLPVWALPALVALWSAQEQPTLFHRFYFAQAPPVSV